MNEDTTQEAAAAKPANDTATQEAPKPDDGKRILTDAQMAKAVNLFKALNLACVELGRADAQVARVEEALEDATDARAKVRTKVRTMQEQQEHQLKGFAAAHGLDPDLPVHVDFDSKTIAQRVPG